MASSSNPSSSDSTTRRPSWQHKYVREMSPEERLASLKEWAEEKKMVTPGEGGTLATGIGGINALAFGGPMPVTRTQTQGQGRGQDRWQGQYDAPVGPPSYQSAIHPQQPGKKQNPLKRWVEKRKAKKDAKRNASVPPYVP
ncbi:hypothetical protein AC578_2855 [Pseudocercospora eumusae]|uniref:Uncharacterized protein n=1 Tax=Pseudocercospora eumusae TaxID=321146 RepID=A0A139H3I8_9PEZI|nr:hypothetical protein AC578_2855 [Pseudocercospora eumusae]